MHTMNVENVIVDSLRGFCLTVKNTST